MIRRAVDRACIRLVIWLTGLMSDRAAWQLTERMRGYWTGEAGQRVLRELAARRR